MTSDPIDQEKLRKAREWAKESSTHGYPTSHEYRTAVDVIMSLPEPEPLTMANIPWSDAEHHLAEADAGPHGNVVMLEPYRSKYGRFIRLLMPDSPHQNKVDGMAASGLTPTGRKMKLVPAEWEGGPVPDRQPGTTEPVEDRPEPQPGEAWLVAYSHVPNETFNVIFDHGGHSYDSQGSVWGLDEVTPLHRLSPVVEPRILVTEDDYYNAPNGTVVQEDERFPCHQKRMNVWVMAGSEVNSENRDMSGIPRTVIWEQEA